MSRTRLTREGWYYLVVLSFLVVSGSMRQINLILAMAGMMVGVLYFNWRGVRSMLRHFEIRRRLPETIVAGQPLVVELSAASPHSCNAVVVADCIRVKGDDSALGLARGLALFAKITAGQATRGEYRVVFGERGPVQFGPIWATTRFPFGLVSRQVQLRAKDELLVLPRLGRMTGRWNQRARTLDYATRQPLRSQGAADGDFYGLRDWQPGDSRRLIHWRTSARRGGLMVRQFEQPPNENLTLLVDLWQPAGEAEQESGRERVELAIRFAATAVAEACRRGGSMLTVVVAGRETARFSGGGCKMLARDILRHLALVEAYSEPNGQAKNGPNGETAGDRLRELFDRAAERSRAASPIVLVTTRPIQAAPARALCLRAGSEAFFQFFEDGDHSF